MTATQGSDAGAEPRVVSLIASATEIVCGLGGEHLLVGRSHECDYPPSIGDRPVCSHAKLDVTASSRAIDDQVKSLLRDAVSIYGLHAERIDALRPTHIITQSQCDVCAVSLSDVEVAVCERFDSSPDLIVLEPNAIEDVWADIARVGHALGIGSTDDRVAALRRRMPDRDPASGPRVLCVEWTDPPMVAGNWVPALVRAAGGVPLLARDGVHSPYLTAEQIAACDPEVIVFMPCGFDLPRTTEESVAVLEREPWRSLAAVRSGGVYFTDGNAYFNRPGPRVVESAEILCEIFDDHHAVSSKNRLAAWTRWSG